MRHPLSYVVAAFCAVALWAGCQDSANPVVPDETGALTGVVRDRHDLLIANAVVEARGANGALISSDSSDEDGAFALAGLPSDLAGTTLRASAWGFATMDVDLKAFVESNGRAARLTLLSGDSACASLHVRVTTSGDSALAGAKVKLRRNGATHRTAEVGSDGWARIREIIPGTYSMRVFREPGYQGYDTTITIDDCDSVVRHVVLLAKGDDDPDSCCHGVIEAWGTDSTGQFVGPTQIKLSANGQHVTYTSSTEPVRFTGLCPGTYHLRYSYGGMVKETSVIIGCNDSLELPGRFPFVTDSLCCGNVLAIQFLDSATRQAFTGGGGTIRKGNATIGQASIDDSGWARFTNLCEGAYNVRMEIQGVGVKEFDVVVHCGGDSITKVFKRSDDCCKGVLRVGVSDSLHPDKNIGGMATLKKGGSTVKTVGSQNGWFDFGQVCAGTYAVRIAFDHYKVLEFEATVTCNQTDTVYRHAIAEEGECCKGDAVIFVRDQNQQPVKNAAVRLWINGAMSSKATNADGAAEFANLCEGRYEGAVAINDQVKASFEIHVLCDSVTVRELVVQRSDSCSNGKFIFIAKDSSTHQRLQGAEVRLMVGNTVLERETNGDGRATYEGMPGARTYTYTMRKDGYADVTGTVTMPAPCQTKEILIMMIPD